jgi:hypothetical protein
MGQSYRLKMKCQEKWIRGRLENGGIAFIMEGNQQGRPFFDAVVANTNNPFTYCLSVEKRVNTCYND